MQSGIMTFDEVKEILLSSNLNFSESMIKDTHNFTSNDSFPNDIVNSHSKKYIVYATSAIVSELKLVPKIQSLSFANCGITIEKIVSHLPSELSKEEFLEILKKISKNS